eukprot:TRINITY_DN67550_c1_g1_i1.p1 TRINITY_DN67550_c1_g1~~TRINITY_DN67550_c1_g1_i1.p1  ORF type:complete len:1075 (+),score=128.67 TRINITY_DN67550_c1_g1_i1:51-3275(+)
MKDSPPPNTVSTPTHCPAPPPPRDKHNERSARVHKSLSRSLERANERDKEWEGIFENEELEKDALMRIERERERTEKMMREIDTQREQTNVRDKEWHRNKQLQLEKLKQDLANREANLAKSAAATVDGKVGGTLAGIREHHSSLLAVQRKQQLDSLCEAKRVHRLELEKQVEKEQLLSELKALKLEKKAQAAAFVEREQSAENTMQREMAWRDEREELRVKLESERCRAKINMMQAELDRVHDHYREKELEWEQTVFKERAVLHEQKHEWDLRMDEVLAREHEKDREITALKSKLQEMTHDIETRERRFQMQLGDEVSKLQMQEQEMERKVLSTVAQIVDKKEQEYNARIQQDQDAAQAAIVMNEILVKTFRRTERLHQPNVTRTSFLWAMIEQAFHYLTRFQPLFSGVLKRVRDEALKGVFVQPPTPPDEVKPLHIPENASESAWRPLEKRFNSTTWFDQVRASQKTINDLQSKLKIKDKHLDSLNSQIKDAKEKIKGLSNEILLLQRDTKLHQQKSAELQSQCDNLTKRNTELQQAKLQLEEKISKMDNDLALTLKRCGSLQNQKPVCKVKYILSSTQERQISSGAGINIVPIIQAVETGLSDWEETSVHQQLRKQTSQLLREPPGVSTLLTWIQCMLKQHPRAASFEGMDLDVSVPSADLFNAWLALLNVLCPSLLPNEECSVSIAQPELAPKAEVLARVMKKLQLPTCTEEHLLVPDGYFQRLLALGALFHWFCDPSLGRLTGLESTQEVAPMEEAECPITPQGELDYSMQLMKKWRLQGVQTMRGIEGVLLDKLIDMMSSEPKSPQEMLERALQCRAEGELKKCLQLLERGISVTPASNPIQAEMYYVRGMTRHHFLQPKDMSGALQDYNRAITLRPEFAAALKQRADILHYDFEQLENALQNYDQAILYGSVDADTFNNRAEVWMKLQNWEKALKDLDEALKSNPAHANAQRNHAEVKPIVVDKQRKAAEEALTKALEELPVIQFERNESKLDADDVAGLNAVAEILAQYPLIRLRVIGSTTKEKLIPLAEARAKVCAEYIAKKGIDPERLEEKGTFGDAKATMFEPI